MTITTTDGNKQVDVIWDLENVNGYNPNSEDKQTFIISGEVKLPDGVTNTNNVSLEVTISVTGCSKNGCYCFEGGNLHHAD